jgi:hypothetical protein
MEKFKRGAFMKRKYVFCIALTILLIIVNVIYDKYEINSRFQFDNTNIKQVWFFQGNHGLDYNVTMDINTLQGISNELIVGGRKKIQGFSITEQPSELMISLSIALDNGQINIIQGDDDRTYVVSSKLGGTSKAFEYKSKYLSDLLMNLYDQYAGK